MGRMWPKGCGLSKSGVGDDDGWEGRRRSHFVSQL